MKLYHQTKHLGNITDVSVEGFWMSGFFETTPEGLAFQPFFYYMTDEDHQTEEPPFSAELLDPKMWFVEEDGVQRGIEVPAVHPDGTIDWRWR